MKFFKFCRANRCFCKFSNLQFQSFFKTHKFLNCPPNLCIVCISIKCSLCLVLLWVLNDFGPSKLFWSSTNGFGRVQFILVRSKSFWTGPNYKKQSNLNLTKMIWTRPNQFGPNQNNLKVQNNFGPIEGQRMEMLRVFPVMY